jgi:hypothetical protein
MAPLTGGHAGCTIGTFGAAPWAYSALCSELLLFLSRLAARFCFNVLDAAVLVLLPPLSLLAMASSLGRGPIWPTITITQRQRHRAPGLG